MSVKLGNILLNKIYLGATVLNKLYIGAIIVYQAGNQIITDYIARVLADGGVVESVYCVETELSETASLQMIPSGYKATKLYSVLPENGVGDFTVDRNSTATRVNEQGLIEEMGVNVPLIDHSDGGCPVLLTQPQSTNLITYSEEIDNVIWTALGTITIDPNASISPDGTLSADSILGVTSGSSVSSRYSSGTTGFEYTNSCYIKNIDCTTSQIFIRNASNAIQCNLNWSGSILDSITDLIGVTTYKDVGDGWYRISSTYIAVETTQRTRYIPALTDSNKSFYLWGAQLEQLSYPTSYIKTEGSTVTRLQDVVTVTPPVGTTEIIETIDGIEQAPITVIPPTYTVPFGNINQIIMND